VNSAAMTPSVAEMIDADSVSRILKKLTILGEPLHESHIEQWADPVQLQNFYGPTECCVNCIGTELISEPKANASNVGSSLGALTWVVDQYDGRRLVSIGAVGEQWIQSPGIADGYLRDSETTAASFVTPPTCAKELGIASPDSGLYKAGDLVRYEGNGSLDYQVQVRGQRLELREIEHHLRRVTALEELRPAVDLVKPFDRPDLQLLTVFIAGHRCYTVGERCESGRYLKHCEAGLEHPSNGSAMCKHHSA
jgi:non-ribosomal peptide synthetase component F